MAEQFELLLQQLMSPENDVRTPAETAYEAIQPPQKVPLLIQVLLFISTDLGETWYAVSKWTGSSYVCDL